MNIWLNDSELKVSLNLINDNIIENRIDSDFQSALLEQLHLCSVYKGRPVPSLLFDSVGTKKMASLASFIINSLEQGRILVVDEIDSSLHFKLTRAIFSLFNNELNTKGQLICTAHDVSLLDCKRMFRKEQIWFASKDKEGVYLYSLSDFKADEDGVRGRSDLIEKYKKGLFDALPSPDLFKALMNSCKLNPESDNKNGAGNEIDFLSLIDIEDGERNE